MLHIAFYYWGPIRKRTLCRLGLRNKGIFCNLFGFNIYEERIPRQKLLHLTVIFGEKSTKCVFTGFYDERMGHLIVFYRKTNPVFHSKFKEIKNKTNYSSNCVILSNCMWLGFTRNKSCVYSTGFTKQVILFPILGLTWNGSFCVFAFFSKNLGAFGCVTTNEPLRLIQRLDFRRKTIAHLVGFGKTAGNISTGFRRK